MEILVILWCACLLHAILYEAKPRQPTWLDDYLIYLATTNLNNKEQR